MTSMDAARRELKRLRDKLRAEDREFRASAPAVDSEGLPMWDAREPLSVEGYMKAMGFDPDEELTEDELETRRRLAPYASVFALLERDEELGGEDVK